MKTLRTLVVSAALLMGGLFVAPTAGAVTGDHAAAIANGESAVICPHHSSGKCLKRRSAVVGTGSGTWTGYAEGWECYSWEPCGILGNPATARWYYEEQFYIRSDGSIYGRRYL